MAQLMFYDERHEYQLDGVVLPNVSYIIRFISKEKYGEISQSILDNAADRGTRVHKTTEAIDKYGSTEVDMDITAYVSAYINFRKEHKTKWEMVEHSTFHKDEMYAGTVDRVGDIDGVRCLVDIKTSSQLQKPLYTAQLNLYQMMLESQGVNVDKLYILQLKKDGSYKLVEIPKDRGLANACLTIHKALAPKRRAKK